MQFLEYNFTRFSSVASPLSRSYSSLFGAHRRRGQIHSRDKEKSSEFWQQITSWVHIGPAKRFSWYFPLLPVVPPEDVETDTRENLPCSDPTRVVPTQHYYRWYSFSVFGHSRRGLGKKNHLRIATERESFSMYECVSLYFQHLHKMMKISSFWAYPTTTSGVHSLNV